MLYAIIGESKKGREKLHELLAVLKKKQPDAEEMRLDADNFSLEALDELIQSQGLFSTKYIVVLDGLLGNAEMKEMVTGRFKDIAEAEHAFLLLEEKTDAKTKKEIEKAAAKVYEIKDAAPIKAFSFGDSFAIAEALGKRDKVTLWKLYTERLRNGDRVEEIHGQLVWQAKSMVLASKSKSGAEVDMKDFPYSKAKSFLKNYAEEEIENLLFNLVSVYHEAHRGGVELEIALEKVLLEI